MRRVYLSALAGLVASLVLLHAPQASSLTATLTLLCGAIAATAVAVANYRERVVLARRVRRLKDPATRRRALAETRAHVDRALLEGDPIQRERKLREALVPLLSAELWNEVATLARAARRSADRQQRPVSAWLAGIHALAELHRGDLDAAEAALAGQSLDKPWLMAIDAVRLALGGQPDRAMRRIAQLDSRGHLAVGARFQRDLAEVHALAALGRRSDARQRLEASLRRRDGVAQAAAQVEGPASALARSFGVGAGGPFRRPG